MRINQLKTPDKSEKENFIWDKQSHVNSLTYNNWSVFMSPGLIFSVKWTKKILFAGPSNNLTWHLLFTQYVTYAWFEFRNKGTWHINITKVEIFLILRRYWKSQNWEAVFKLLYSKVILNAARLSSLFNSMYGALMQTVNYADASSLFQPFFILETASWAF